MIKTILTDLHFGLTILLFCIVLFLYSYQTGWLDGTLWYCNPLVTKEYCHRFDDEAVDYYFMFDRDKEN
jgi:hypothetical protein